MSTYSPPVSQSRQALEHANRVRVRRGQVCRKLRQLPTPAALATAVDVLRAPEPFLEGMAVRRLLAAIPQYGPWRITKVLRKANIPETRTLGQLTDRQRDTLADQLTRPSGEAAHGV